MFNIEIRKFYDWGDIGGGASMGATIGSVVPGVGTALGAVAGGLFGGITGLFQKKGGQRLLKQTPYPTYSVPSEILANQQRAQNLALEGMPSQQYQMAQKNIQNAQNAAIQEAQDRRGGLASISAIQQGTNQAMGNLDATSAQQRLANEQQLMNVNTQVAGYRDKAFEWNQANRYNQNYQYAMGLLGSGNQNLVSGFDRLFAGTGALFAGRSMGMRDGSSAGSPSPYMYQPAIADTGATGPGGNTDVIMNPSAPNIQFNNPYGNALSNLYTGAQ